MLSEILVGIDFSQTSEKALRLAIDIANRTNANIVMAWVEVGGDISKDKAIESFENLVKTSRQFLESKEREISYVITSGKVSHALNEIVRKRKSSLMVIGTHGKSGFDEAFAGANAYKAIASCPVPVLALREKFDFCKPLEKIILPIDSTADTRQKVPWTIEFAKMFPNAQILVLGLYSFKSKDMREIVQNYTKSVEVYLQKENMKYSVEYRESENSTITTIDYAKEVNGDMIVIMKEQEKTLTNLFFLGPYALQMINRSPIPVLTVPTRQINDEGR